MLPVWGGLYLEGLIHGGAYFSENYSIYPKISNRFLFYKNECREEYTARKKIKSSFQSVRFKI